MLVDQEHVSESLSPLGLDSQACIVRSLLKESDISVPDPQKHVPEQTILRRTNADAIFIVMQLILLCTIGYYAQNFKSRYLLYH